MGRLPQPMTAAQLQKLREDAQAKQQPITSRPLPEPYTSAELELLRAAAARKGGQLDDREIAAALGRKYQSPDPLGLRRLQNYVEVN